MKKSEIIHYKQPHHTTKVVVYSEINKRRNWIHKQSGPSKGEIGKFNRIGMEQKPVYHDGDR